MKNVCTDIDRINDLLEIGEELNHVKDIDSLLDNILHEARRFTNADAGSIFLKEGDELIFSYVQNDTLASRDETHNKHIYQTLRIPISEKSISGHVALKGEPIIIDDVYKLPENLPYSFNSRIDEILSYHTHSILTVPMVTSREQIVGVMQIINAKDSEGNIIPFTDNDKSFVSFFANNASVAIERAKMTREIILRMIKMAELRDPKETGSHVNRVGSYCIEIYQKLAKKKGIPPKEIKQQKDILRIAAMLHDVGKVAISDTILKKPDHLTDDEREIMKSHTVQGARLFENTVSELDQLSAHIALNHHERWDGKGYPAGISGEEIPLAARICALADVYDALASQRVYKDKWNDTEVIEYISGESGKHFDPELVEVFLSIYDIIKAIKEKYHENH